MKLFATLILGLTFSLPTMAFDINKATGLYKGICTVTYSKTVHSSVNVYTTEQEAALYVGQFINAKGELVDLAISTEQFTGDYSLPESFAFLLKADQEGLEFVKEVVANGLTGTDNNLGKLNQGASYKYNYISQKSGDALTVTTEKIPACVSDLKLCNPPVLQACSYFRNSKGEFFEGCVRSEDKTVIKQISNTELVSERSASQYGKPVNNYSFALPAISSQCVWEKQ